MELKLDAIEARVLGCLIEKARTTPDHYPLTLNALVAACNQKSNRNPLMDVDAATVDNAINRLRPKGLAMAVHNPGDRVPKFKHAATAKLDLLDDEEAVLAELLLRGPQTVGELRGRAVRMHPFTEADEVLSALTRLARRGLAVELKRLPGHKEPRWAHLLCGEPDVTALAEQAAAHGKSRATVISDDARIAALEAEVAALREQFEHLSQEFAAFRAAFE